MFIRININGGMIAGRIERNRDAEASFFVFCRIEKWVYIRIDKLV